METRNRRTKVLLKLVESRPMLGIEMVQHGAQIPGVLSQDRLLLDQSRLTDLVLRQAERTVEAPAPDVLAQPVQRRVLSRKAQRELVGLFTPESRDLVICPRTLAGRLHELSQRSPDPLKDDVGASDRPEKLALILKTELLLEGDVQAPVESLR